MVVCMREINHQAKGAGTDIQSINLANNIRSFVTYLNSAGRLDNRWSGCK